MHHLYVYVECTKVLRTLMFQETMQRALEGNVSAQVACDFTMYCPIYQTGF